MANRHGQRESPSWWLQGMTFNLIWGRCIPLKSYKEKIEFSRLLSKPPTSLASMWPTSDLALNKTTSGLKSFAAFGSRKSQRSKSQQVSKFRCKPKKCKTWKSIPNCQSRLLQRTCILPKLHSILATRTYWCCSNSDSLILSWMSTCLRNTTALTVWLTCLWMARSMTSASKKSLPKSKP